MDTMIEVVWQNGEDLLVEVFELLGALPDRERRWLSPGRGQGLSCWPQVVREVQQDYGEGQGVAGEAERRVRRRVGVQEMALLDAVLLGEAPLALAIPPQHRALVGRVVALKKWSAGGFAWEDVRKRMVPAGMTARAAGVPSGDALRMRYERAIARMVAEWARRVRRAGSGVAGADARALGRFLGAELV